MNDRLKFRVFDKEEKLFLGKASGTPTPLMNGDTGIICYLKELNPKYVIQQCTGLKDRKGKLIFEGDIVKVVTENNRTLYSVENHTNAEFGNIYRIFFDNDYLSWGFTQVNRLKNRCYPEFLSIGVIDDGKFKIIGNIYENPELLTRED